MAKKMRVLLFVLITFFAFCSLFYLFNIFQPFVKAQGDRGLARWGADYYSRWAATRGLLKDGIDPYSRLATVRNQIGYFGAPLQEGSDRDPQRFNYPGHAVLFFIPFSLFSFGAARVLMLFVLALCTLCSIAVWLKIMDVRPQNRIPMFVLAITSWPFLQALYLEQPSLFVVLLLTVAVFASSKGHFFGAGCLLALSTIKPQLVLPSILWLLIWSNSRNGGKKIIAGFVVTLGSLFSVSEWLIPGWVTEWIANAHEWFSFTSALPSLEFVFGKGIGISLTVLLVAISVYFLWNFRNAKSDSDEFRYSVALVFAVTMLLLPRSSWHSYDEVLFFPSIVYLVIRLKNFKSESAIAGIPHLLSLFANCWPYFATALLTGLHFLGASLNTESVVRAPTYGFFLVAPITTVALLLLREAR